MQMLTPCAYTQASTEGDAFTMAFHDSIDAVSWALEVQHKLLQLAWPEELLTQADAKEEHTPDFVASKVLLFRGLRVRMALHTGLPDALQVSGSIPACDSAFCCLDRQSLHGACLLSYGHAFQPV